MAVTLYQVGDLVRVSAVFKDINGAEQDPASVFFKFRQPGGAVVTYEYTVDAALVKDSTGNYHVDIDADTEGVVPYRFYATGSGKAAAEGSFKVKKSQFS